MGHSLGLDDNYYRPSEEKVLGEYYKAINDLTINEENRLKKQITELEQKEYEIAHMKLEHKIEMKLMHEEMESKFNEILTKIDVKKLH